MMQIFKSLLITTFIFHITGSFSANAFEFDLEIDADITFKDFNFEGDLDFNKPYLFVSLGCNCWSALALRMHGFRNAAFPFDWLVTSDHDGFAKCLEEDFEHFTNAAYFQRFGTHGLDNIRYNFRFIHDWPHSNEVWNYQKHLEQLDFIKKKYARRITRFLNLNNFKGKLFFIRAFELRPDYIGEPGRNTHSVKRVYDALKRIFPAVDFTLVVISVTDPQIPEIEPLEGVIEYKVGHEGLTQDNFKIFWQELKGMFMSLTEPYRVH